VNDLALAEALSPKQWEPKKRVLLVLDRATYASYDLVVPDGISVPAGVCTRAPACRARLASRSRGHGQPPHRVARGTRGLRALPCARRRRPTSFAPTPFHCWLIDYAR
jgi:hypothetical protein